MDIKVQGEIIEVEEARHLIVVRYFSEQYPPEPVDSNLRPDGRPVRCKYDRAITIWETPMPTGEKLADIISKNGFSVKAEMELRQALENPAVDTSMTAAKEHVIAQTVFDVVPPMAIVWPAIVGKIEKIKT
jgi:hypothetical protein